MPELVPPTLGNKVVAWAIANGGVITADDVVKAGIADYKPNASATLRKLHARGRLERVAPDTYATPDKAAALRAQKKSERAEKNAETTT